MAKADKNWYKPFVVPGVIALILIGIVMIVIPGEIDRFTLIMPIFAGYILFMILTAIPDEE
ncbi:hypothetical protein HYT02_06185 [Candidatus Gottesmanbacteria bacterium]|nr:hypothetical protein [Candidatus Gottesmanbacteria bacterium]